MPPKGKSPENSQAKGPFVDLALWKVEHNARAEGVSKRLGDCESLRLKTEGYEMRLVFKY